MMNIAYLNGQYLPLDEARVPVLDRGYLFGDGVYEVIPAYRGKAFRLDDHLARLQQSLAAIRLPATLLSADWPSIINELLALNGASDRDQAIYLQISRGVATTRAHGLPSDCTPSVLAFTWPLPSMSESIRNEGVSVITRADIRWQRCDIKAIALLANIMLADEAMQDGHNEAILHRDNVVTEGASSNVFLLSAGQLATPPKSNLILHGITRAFILELAQQAGLSCTERELSLTELRAADEVWISSSTRELLPVTAVDGAPVADGKPGDYWRKVYGLYQTQKYL